MSEIYLVKFISVFLLGMLSGSVLHLIARELRIKNQRHEKGILDSSSEKVIVTAEKNDFPVLSKMQYFLASNDDATGQTYSATPLQDSNPKDMA
jgi:hypothetical protein